VADVEKAVKFAADRDWVVAAKSGGHSHIGSSIRDDALVIDMSAMDSVELDPVTRKAKVGPGVKSEQLVTELAKHGLSFPAGHCRNVRMGGYLLGGGFGINWNQWGPACYSVTGADVVGPDGSVRTINDENDGDLMWLARGCGPSFPGVITAYYLDVKPIPASIRTSMYVFPLAETAAVTQWFDELRPVLSTTVEPFAVLSGPVFVADAPPDARFIAVGARAFDMNDEAAEAALRPFQSAPTTPLAAYHASPGKLQDVFIVIDRFLPPENVRMHADAIWSDDSKHRVLGLLEGHVKSSPSPLNNVLCYQPPRMPLQDNACFSMMRSNCVTIYGTHKSDAEDRANADWVAEGMALLEPVTAGYWVNETDLTADPARARRSFAPEVWEKMRRVRASYDPEGLFADYIRSDS
jgi:FAD/FMN-containing dehydrogenase